MLDSRRVLLWQTNSQVPKSQGGPHKFEEAVIKQLREISWQGLIFLPHLEVYATKRPLDFCLLDALKKFKTYSPKWWFFMVIYPGKSRKSPKKQIQATIGGGAFFVPNHF